MTRLPKAILRRGLASIYPCPAARRPFLERLSLHFHRLGDTMRGSSVVGASIWDSGNRWITIHGTNYLVVRDCVGYQSVGHGFFLEDGTEVNNVLDRNLAVQSYIAKKLPDQVLPFDQNEGAGFWWANSRNSFTRNVTCENDRYGYRFDATPNHKPGLIFPVLQPDGSRREVDVRTLPFVRFEGNESHCDGKYGLNLGEGVDRIGPEWHCRLRRLKLRRAAGEQRGPGLSARGRQQRVRFGAAFHRPRFHPIRPVADAMRTAVEDTQRDQRLGDIAGPIRHHGGQQPAVRQHLHGRRKTQLIGPTSGLVCRLEGRLTDQVVHQQPGPGFLAGHRRRLAAEHVPFHRGLDVAEGLFHDPAPR
jgi:hypothetical protein